MQVGEILVRKQLDEHGRSGPEGIQALYRERLGDLDQNFVGGGR